MIERIKTGLALMGVLSLLGCSNAEEPASPAKTDLHLAFVLLSQPVLPSFEELKEAYAEFTDTDDTLLLVENATDTDTQEKDTNENLIVRIPDIGTAIIALISKSIPNQEAETGYQYSLSSFGEDHPLGSHEAHLLVTLFGIDTEKPPVQALSSFTSLLAAIGKATPSIGIHWGDQGVTHPMTFFHALATNPEVSNRVILWTGVSQAPEDDDRISFLSWGMSQLALPDLYLVSAKERANQNMRTFYALLAYMINRGTPISDGDTIGFTDEEKIPVRYVDSPANNGETVLRVDL